MKFKAEALPLKDEVGGYRILYSHNCQFGLSQFHGGSRTAMATLAACSPPSRASASPPSRSDDRDPPAADLPAARATLQRRPTAPGPNLMLIVPIGDWAADPAGTAVALPAFFAPTALLTRRPAVLLLLVRLSRAW